MENPPWMENPPPWDGEPPLDGEPPGWRNPPLDGEPPPPYGKERAVRILLECILVSLLYCSVQQSKCLNLFFKKMEGISPFCEAIDMHVLDF